MTPANASTAMATVLVDELVRCGVRELVLAPGSRSAALGRPHSTRSVSYTHLTLPTKA